MFIQEFVCPICGDTIEINLESYITDKDSYEREGHTETSYYIESDPIACPSCDKSVAVSGTIYEYPQGVASNAELEISIY